ncbi:DUF3558 family protein [Nocardiopsis sp. L17-MgMaSL7]|uniref:DUF3558 family protein n=1 Tax=Nocardiopsis sp. L17-MgMaSL7 TaxID=1938893 RepID=UPI000D71BA18|nr:DUF3558 family protein [Nocardiopsis sp. L17-MgMaSL7]PWV58019.1 uncharacterized protein DUF3558 [Nocardiopsis sp. L17-MgMaSL7]
MRVRAAVVVALLLSGCAVDLEERDSIRQFEVAALDPTDTHPCDLLPDATAVELGILDEEGEGSPQSDANCFYTNRVDASVDLRVEVHEEKDAVESTVSAAFSGADDQEFASVEGYPGVTTEFPDSCNLTVAVSDEHSFYVQVSADEACEVAVEVARTAITNAQDA